jgi:hypothetical protein
MSTDLRDVNSIQKNAFTESSRIVFDQVFKHHGCYKLHVYVLPQNSCAEILTPNVFDMGPWEEIKHFFFLVVLGFESKPHNY